MIRRPPRSTQSRSSAASDVYKRQTPQMLIRFMPDVIDLHPKAVAILAGTNDIAGNTGFSSVKMITDNIKAMAQLAVANDIEVILCSVLPVYELSLIHISEPTRRTPISY